MAKETHMQTIQTEIKGIAKAVGASLKRSGHQVPHSVLLHAVSAALNKRDWHKLKASFGDQRQDSAKSAMAQDDVVTQLYSSTTMGLLRLASVLLRPVYPLPIDDAEARQAAYLTVGPLAGTVTFKDLAVPAVLNPQGWLISEPADTVRQRMGIGSLSFARFSFETPAGVFSADAEYTPSKGWSLTSAGEQELFDQLSEVVPAERLFPMGSKVFLGNIAHLPPIGAGSVLKDCIDAPPAVGPEVKARFRTDDHHFVVDFDAQEYFAQASVGALFSIAEVGFTGDYCTDNVAEFMQGRNADIDEGFAYLLALQRSKMKDPPGFECSVDEGDFYRWMDAHRRNELAQWLCESAAVTLSEATEPEILGQWCWFTDEEACDQSFETREAACLDAYDKLGLLEQAINGEL